MNYKEELYCYKVSINFDSNLLSFFYLEVAQGHMNEGPNETQIHSWRFASLAC